MLEDIEISIVVPVYNELENLPELCRRLVAVCEGLATTWELVLVDDGSSDGSRSFIVNAAKGNTHIKYIFFPYNRGQHEAVKAGFSDCSGRYAITLDADLQNPPEEVPKLVRELKQGYDVVGTIRELRQDSLWRKITSKIVNKVVHQLCGGLTMHDYGCMLRGYSREVIERIVAYPGQCHFVPVMAMFFANTSTEIYVKHGAREAGTSKYSPWGLVVLFAQLLLACYEFKKYKDSGCK